MKIVLTHQESETYFLNALYNGLGYFQSYGIEIDFKKEDYAKARKSLVKQKKSICYEDVLMEILKIGKCLLIIDNENEMREELEKTIKLTDVHKKVQKTPFSHLMDMINEQDDTDTADVILQTVFFEKVIFG